MPKKSVETFAGLPVDGILPLPFACNVVSLRSDAGDLPRDRFIVHPGGWVVPKTGTAWPDGEITVGYV